MLGEQQSHSNVTIVTERERNPLRKPLNRCNVNTIVSVHVTPPLRGRGSILLPPRAEMIFFGLHSKASLEQPLLRLVIQYTQTMHPVWGAGRWDNH